MPNVIAALPNIDGAICSMPQSLAQVHYLSVAQWRRQDMKLVKICRDAPNSRTYLSR